MPTNRLLGKGTKIELKGTEETYINIPSLTEWRLERSIEETEVTCQYTGGKRTFIPSYDNCVLRMTLFFDRANGFIVSGITGANPLQIYDDPSDIVKFKAYLEASDSTSAWVGEGKLMRRTITFGAEAATVEWEITVSKFDNRPKT